MMRLTNTKLRLLLLSALFSVSTVVADDDMNNNPTEEMKKVPEGWSLDVGGTYTWMAITTPPTYSGSTGGILGKLTYQTPWEFFGQVRSIYNLGKLSSSLNKTRFYEWYTEFVGGYCFTALKNWTITPYVGMGLDYIHDNHEQAPGITPIGLRYDTYYAIAGLDTHYTQDCYMVGLQVEALPVFNQYLRIKTLSGQAWTLSNKPGAAVRLPMAIRCYDFLWLELAPYYRFFPIGSSDYLSQANRNLNQWGAFLTLRFFL